MLLKPMKLSRVAVGMDINGDKLEKKNNKKMLKTEGGKRDIIRTGNNERIRERAKELWREAVEKNELKVDGTKISELVVAYLIVPYSHLHPVLRLCSASRSLSAPHLHIDLPKPQKDTNTNDPLI